MAGALLQTFGSGFFRLAKRDNSVVQLSFVALDRVELGKIRIARGFQTHFFE